MAMPIEREALKTVVSWPSDAIKVFFLVANKNKSKAEVALAYSNDEATYNSY